MSESASSSASTTPSSSSSSSSSPPSRSPFGGRFTLNKKTTASTPIKTATNKGMRAASLHPLKTSLHKSFLSQDVSSSTTIEGTVRQHPSQTSTPFSFQMPSGLARTQQVHMLQRFLNLPALPSYIKNEGGFVLDRVVTQFGGNEWWSTATLRIRAQRMWNTRETVDGKPHRAMMLPSMYGLGAKVRVGVFEKTTLKGVMEMKSLTRLVRKFILPASADENIFSSKTNRKNNVGNANSNSDLSKIYSILDGSMERRTEEERDAERANRAPTSCRITLTSKILPGHTLSCDLSSGEKYQIDDGYIDGPTVAQASISSRGRRQVHYKAGVSQILDKHLPEFEAKVVKNKGAGTTSSHAKKFQKPPRREARAGVSVEQQIMVWKGKRRRKKNSGNSMATTTASSYSALPQMPNLTFGFIGGVIGRWNLDGRHIVGRSSSKSRRRMQTKQGKGDTSMNRTMDESILSTEDDDDDDDDDFYNDRTVDASTNSVLDNTNNMGASSRPPLQCELHNFLSASMHFQIGSFSRAILDLTSIDVRVDVGAHQEQPNALDLRDSNFGYMIPENFDKNSNENAQNNVGKKIATRAQKFLTMDGLLVPDPSSVTVSLCQQILGPITFKGEIRASGGETLNALRVGAKKLTERKSLQECRDEASKELKNPEIIYGVDCPLPPALGTARLVGWYNINRQEAFVECRLFDM